MALYFVLKKSKYVRFVFEGLETVMEDILLSNSRYIRFANAHGIKKVLRNVLALRQSIKTMSSWSPDSEFKRARQYYGLFEKGPQVRREVMPHKCF